MNNKKFFNGSNSGKKERNHVKKTNDASTKKETKPLEKIVRNFSQKEPKYVNKINCIPVKYINPRHLSFFILNRYFSEKSNLKSLLNEFLKKYSLSELDRRFVYEIVKGTVRYFIRIDFLISLFSNKNIKSIDKDVLNILRLAVYQLLYMNKTPAYAAIDESVEIAKRHIGTYSSRFVNAVLRKINTEPKIQEFLDNSIKNTYTKPGERLSVMYSYPEWLAEYWIKSFGVERTEFLFRSLNCEPQVFIRVNRLKTDKIKLIKDFSEYGMLQGRDFFSESLDSIENSGNIENFGKRGFFDECIVLKSVQNIEIMPCYLQGHFSVQDFSSQFAIKHFLDPAKHDKILDICGAPGGKATYMAELTDDEAEIVSVDINRKKMDLLEENIVRLGIKNISIVNADATETSFLRQDKFENYFDKIFIDAPCSALGTISKNPDAKYANTISDMERLGEISFKMLSAAEKYLKPGGIMILYKCTLSEIENQEPVKRFIRQNPGRYHICYPLSEYAGVSDTTSDLQPGSPKDKYHHLKQANMLIFETCLKPLNKKYPFFEIMPDYFSSEAGFICMLKKSV